MGKSVQEVRKQQRSLKRIGELVDSYVHSYAPEYRESAMNSIVNVLFMLLALDADKHYPDQVLVALAGMAGEMIAPTQFSHFSSCTQDASYLATIRNQALKRAAGWLIANARESFLLVFSRSLYTDEGAEKLLKELFDEYFFPPRPEAA